MTAPQIYEDLEFPRSCGKSSELPYIVINAVSTLDGKVARWGKSSGTGSDVDRRAMRVIRSRVDAVLVGAGTVRAERLSLTVPEDLATWRERQGKSRQPLGVILSRTGDFQREDLIEISSNLLVLTEADLPEHLRLLGSRHNVRCLLVEGGPTINHELFRERLVNELFITTSPKVYGGEEITLLKGPPLPDPIPDLKLVSAFLYKHELLLRYSCG